VALIRAFVFGVLFFVMGSGIRLLISRFLPELLDDTVGLEDGGDLGSQVDILVEDDDPGAQAGADGGNPALDQSDEDGYTKDEEGGGDSSGAAQRSAARPEEDSGAVDALPGLENMETAFLPPANEEGEEGGRREEPPVRVNPSRNTATRSQGVGDDFDAKEMAQAIQTILKREDKG
jgi:hypothetical protein